MLKNILSTFITRVLGSLLTLVIVLVIARYLGAEKVGTVSLVILAVSILQLIGNFVGGGALIYLAPRSSMLKLIIPSYLWAALTSVAGTLIMRLFHAVPGGYSVHVLLLSFILSLATANFMALMSRERIRAYNIISLLQVVMLFCALALFLLAFRYREVMAYIYGLYISYLFAFFAGFILIFPYLLEKKEGKQEHLLREMFRYGTVMQLGNIFQFLNYRASFYFIEYFISRAAVGVYNVGIQLSESIWLISKSIHLVQFARISNEQDGYHAARLTLGLVKISFLLTLVCIAALIGILWLCFPIVFKPEFAGIKPVMLVMATGILTFSVSIILSPYFSGMGKPVHNTISAAIGLVFTISATVLLIPRLGLPGAALAASLAYTASTVYQFVVFVRITHVRAKDFLLTGKDIITFVGAIKSLRNP